MPREDDGFTMGTVKINTGYTPEEMKNSEWFGSGGGMPVKTPDRATDNNVARKTPEEIKKGLNACAETETCENCDYRDDCVKQLKNAPLTKDALAYIQHLESRLAHVERERDVMKPVFIREMKKYGCTTCEHYIPAAYTQECLGCSNLELKHWVWNGVCPENTKEEA